ncbi:hypothetical protein [Streptomyces sp. NPDC056192]|uniref:hypothetical protein n=1 Tax=Streptomyces sp. NPDC056192 TaxID=3345743 RepID=UPI0035D544D0
MTNPPSIATAAGTSVWQQIVSIRRWIDKQSPVDDSLEALKTRVLTVGEEHGETCEALLATTTGDGHELADALCDVILAAGVALCTADREAQEAFVGSLAWDEHTGKETIGRLVLKLGQEHGAACQAVIGVTAYNPRNGAGHSMDDLVAKLCAVVRAGAAALHRVDSTAEKTFAANLERAYNRSIGVVRLA